MTGANVEDIAVRREQFRCPHFRILVIGRANAGKTTILEKVCGVAKGTKGIIVYNAKSKSDTQTQSMYLQSSDLLDEQLTPDETHAMPSIEVS